MTGTLDVVLLAAWVTGIVYVVRQTSRQPPSAARTGARGRRLRPRAGNGGMSERFTPPPRYVPDGEQTADAVRGNGSREVTVTVEQLPPDRLAIALAGLTPAFLCTLCVVELKQARADGQPDPEVHPGIVMGEIITDGRPTVGVLCEVRHALALATPAPAAAVQLGG